MALRKLRCDRPTAVMELLPSEEPLTVRQTMEQRGRRGKSSSDAERQADCLAFLLLPVCGRCSWSGRVRQYSQGFVVASPVLLSMTDAEAITPVPVSTAIRANPELMFVRLAHFSKTLFSCFHSPGLRLTV